MFKILPLSVSLILAPLSVCADEAETKERPSFYFSEKRDNGQTIRITTCYKKDSPNPWVSCPNKTDVDNDDLNQFLSEVSSEMESNRGAYHANRLSPLGVLGGLAGMMLSVDNLDFPKKLARPRVFLYSGLVTVASMITVVYSHYGATDYRNLEQLRDQIHSGLIAPNPDNRNHHQIFDRFESFLKDFGRPVVAEQSTGKAFAFNP